MIINSIKNAGNEIFVLLHVDSKVRIRITCLWGRVLQKYFGGSY